MLTFRRPSYVRVTTDKFAYCWRGGDNGQLGNGTTTGPEVCDEAGIGGGIWCSTVPVAVVGGHSFAQVDVGVSHTCARTEANVGLLLGGYRLWPVGQW
jgi:hypothetical protein